MEKSGDGSITNQILWRKCEHWSVTQSVNQHVVPIGRCWLDKEREAWAYPETTVQSIILHMPLWVTHVHKIGKGNACHYSYVTEMAKCSAAPLSQANKCHFIVQWSPTWQSVCRILHKPHSTALHQQLWNKSLVMLIMNESKARTDRQLCEM